MQRAHGRRIAEPQRRRVERQGFLRGVVRLVDGHDDRLAGLAQALRDVFVGVSDAGAGVGHQHDRVGAFDGGVGLRRDVRLNVRLGLRNEAAGVGEQESAPLEFGGRDHAVARRARFLRDDGGASAQERVEQTRLADVGAPDDGD